MLNYSVPRTESRVLELAIELQYEEHLSAAESLSQAIAMLDDLLAYAIDYDLDAASKGNPDALKFWN